MLRRLTILALLAAAASPASAADRVSAADRPDCVAGGPLDIYLLDQSSTSDCDDTPSGTTEAHCCCLNTTWGVCDTGGGGGGDAFKFVDPPSGTTATASGADTLTLISGSSVLGIVGSGGNIITFDLNGTANRCTRWDASGELVAASGDCAAGDTGGSGLTHPQVMARISLGF